ncbi:MAG: hypothetical protein M5U28_07580 [Sandaracinaceae bacterium]|nr:hypothetical protein [Sandaracinaceae bacterium]
MLTLGASAIRDVVRSHRDQLGFCFAWQLHLHPDLRGQHHHGLHHRRGRQRDARAEVADDQLGDEPCSTVLSLT